MDTYTFCGITEIITIDIGFVNPIFENNGLFFTQLLCDDRIFGFERLNKNFVKIEGKSSKRIRINIASQPHYCFKYLEIFYCGPKSELINILNRNPDIIELCSPIVRYKISQFSSNTSSLSQNVEILEEYYKLKYPNYKHKINLPNRVDQNKVWKGSKYSRNINIHLKTLENVIYLDRNENNYGPSPTCLKILRESKEEILNNYTRDYNRGIKSILSERLAFDFGTEERKIILGYGSEDILKQVVQCYITKGDKIMIPSCSWWYYKKIADEADGVNIQYPIFESGDSFYYDTDIIIKIYNESNPKLVLISSPNNPTGNRFDHEELNYLLGKMQDTIVVLDEAYILFDESYKTDPKYLVTRHPNLLILRTFSNYYALAGIRTGFAILGDNFEKLSLLSARYLGFNRLSEKIAIAALDSSKYYEAISRRMAADMKILFEFFNQLNGFLAYKSYANFLLVKIPPQAKTTLNKYLLERKVVVKFMNEEGLNSHIRITLGTHAQNLILMDLINSFIYKEVRELVKGV